MASQWGELTRWGLSTASTLASVGFTVARVSTSYGFSLARSIAPLPGLGMLERAVIAPMILGEHITSHSLVAAAALLDTFGATDDEASFSLAAFVDLVRREWDPGDTSMPEQRPGILAVGRALLAWAALQHETNDFDEERWAPHLRPVTLSKPSLSRSSSPESANDSKFHIVSDTILRHSRAQIITGEIGSSSHSRFASQASRITTLIDEESHEESPVDALSILRRLSKLVLAGYGGPGLWFFGVPYRPSIDAEMPTGTPAASDVSQSDSDIKEREERLFEQAMDTDDSRSLASTATIVEPPESVPQAPSSSYSWWNVITGRRDRDILESYVTGSSASSFPGLSERPTVSSSLVQGSYTSMPRFWVLTDHNREEVVLILRGTMSLNELAVDLTCDPSSFTPAESAPEDCEDQSPASSFEMLNSESSIPMPMHIPGDFDPAWMEAADEETVEDMLREPEPEYLPKSEVEFKHSVHGGMLRLARVMGSRGRPLHIAVRHALEQNEGYGLVLSGHSLGAGVAGMLALMYADPVTCLTVSASGLPRGRRVRAYCIAPPCLVDPILSCRARPLITSFVLSHDVVSRLSLGAIRDICRATAWLGQDGHDNALLSQMVKRRVSGSEKTGDEARRLLATRKTLEANMQFADLVPAGRVFWARPSQAMGQRAGTSPPIYEVDKVETVFKQIIFTRDMLSAHLPHQYDKVLHSLPL